MCVKFYHFGSNYRGFLQKNVPLSEFMLIGLLPQLKQMRSFIEDTRLYCDGNIYISCTVIIKLKKNTF